jgi:hypothetical protein
VRDETIRAVRQCWLQRYRNPGVCALHIGSAKPGFRNTDNLYWYPIQINYAADDAAVAAELTLPQVITDDSGERRAELAALIAPERAADDDPRLKYVKVAA